MIALTRILVPTNLGEPSKAAITYAVAFARQFGAQVLLLRVLPSEDFEATLESERVVETLMPGASPAAEPNLDEVARNAAREALRDLLDPQVEQAVRAEYLLRSAGPDGPGVAIATCARETGAELVIMGKHRLGLVEHMLAGSVTEKVVRQAPCPVLIVQHPVDEFVLPDDPGGATER